MNIKFLLTLSDDLTEDYQSYKNTSDVETSLANPKGVLSSREQSVSVHSFSDNLTDDYESLKKRR